jgi:hypothetical protein
MKSMLLLFLLVIYSTSEGSYLPFNVFTSDTVYYDNFENGLDNWSVYNLASPQNPSLWRISTLKFISPSHSAGWYDSLTNSYPHLSYEAIESPPILIPSNAKVYLSFDVFIHLAPNGSSSNDRFDIQVTTDDGATWTYLSQYAYSGQQIGWKNYPFDFTGETGDITRYAGKTIKVRFLVSTDNIGPNGEGVFIDNFRITKTDCEFNDPYEPNNALAEATQIQPGQNMAAALCPVGDLDFYSINALQNDRINIVISHSVYSVNLALVNAGGYTVASTSGKQLSYNVTTAGKYTVKVSLLDIFTYNVEYNLYVNVVNTRPDVISVTDIPGDEGLKVRVQWQYSLFDPPDAPNSIREYHLFRKVDDTAGFAGKFLQEDDLKLAGGLNGTIILDNNEYWDYISTIPAISPRPSPNYIHTAPTLKDNSEAVFMVAAVSKTAGQPVLWGQPAAGMSIDNVAPQLSSTSISGNNIEITLSWELNNTLYSDVKDIRIYKGMFERFSPEASAMIKILHPLSKSFTDDQPAPGENYYIIAVSDFADNVSHSSAMAGVVTSVNESETIPDNFSLQQNYPNPFNPVTVIEFSLPSARTVHLKVHDILGREVADLAGGEFMPGKHRLLFDAAGLPSGTYFYTLDTGDFSQTKKLILIK